MIHESCSPCLCMNQLKDVLVVDEVGDILFDEGLSFGFGHWNKAVRFGLR